MDRVESSTHKPTRRDLFKRSLGAGLAAGLSGGVWLSGCSRRKQSSNSNIILITLDTTRADHLGCYGYRRGTSPNLDKLAEQSVLYTQAIAPSSWTLPSHASLFTGKFPSSHGAHYDKNGSLKLLAAGLKDRIFWDEIRANGMDPSAQTLAQILRQAGYSTGAVVGGPWLKRVFGLNKDFEHYDDAGISTLNGRRADAVTTNALQWLENVRGGKFFLFLNYFDPHGPWSAPDLFGTAFLQDEKKRSDGNREEYEKRAAYDGEILYMDYHIGRLVEALKHWNLYEGSWVIVTADHGELLGEHGQFGHGRYLYQEEIHVPLFTKYPAGEVPPGQHTSHVQLTDILPLICDYGDFPKPNDIQGSVPPEIAHPIVAETYPLKMNSSDGDWRAIFDGNYKFVWNSKGRHLLFDLANDPEEINNLAEQDVKRVGRMTAKLHHYLAGLPTPDDGGSVRQLDQQTIEALKGLGYLK